MDDCQEEAVVPLPLYEIFSAIKESLEGLK